MKIINMMMFGLIVMLFFGCTQKEDSGGVATYQSSKFGFSLEYPSNWERSFADENANPDKPYGSPLVQFLADGGTSSFMVVVKRIGSDSVETYVRSIEDENNRASIQATTSRKNIGTKDVYVREGKIIISEDLYTPFKSYYFKYKDIIIEVDMNTMPENYEKRAADAERIVSNMKLQ